MYQAKSFVPAILIIVLSFYNLIPLFSQTEKDPVGKGKQPVTEQEELFFIIVEQMPLFPGCDSLSERHEKDECTRISVVDFVQSKLNYPEEARKNEIEGTVVVQFVVEVTGTITHINVVRDIGGGCGPAAIEAVSKMNEMPDKWTPGRQRGNAVAILYTLPVQFKLKQKD